MIAAVLSQHLTEFAIETQGRGRDGRGMTPIGAPVARWVSGALRDAEATEGLLTLFCRHTSASLTIQESVSPEVRFDLEAAFDRLAPRGAVYAHDDEGPDDMPAHIRTVLSGVHLAIPILAGRLALGTWQEIYLWEHRDRPQTRRVAAHLLIGPSNSAVEGV